MNRKILTTFIVSIFIVTSLTAISAADDGQSIPVKIVWDDNGNNRPSSVTINLIKDGNVVDSATLSAASSWKTTFNVNEDGNYQIKENVLTDYSTSVKGNVQNGFVITNKLTVPNENVLSQSDEITNNNESSSTDETPVKETLDNDNVLANESSNNNTEDINNSTDETESNSTSTNENNHTESNTNNNTNTTSKTSKTQNNPNFTKNETLKKIVEKTVKKEPKKQEPKKQNPKILRETGFPIAVLVITVFVAAFIPLKREK